MDIFMVLNLLGGLALFLFGMNQMGDGLEKAAGSKLEGLLDKLTNNRIKGVALGAVVTAVIQSSSATTVMVVGFVNSGIMKLGQAIPVIMGANIGTTMTAWILSMAGIEGTNVFLQLLKPSSFTPVLAVIGTAMTMFSKNEKKHNLAYIFLGFAILMFGMDSMSGAVKPLSDVPQFRNFLTMFENPILGVLTGTVLTAIIQSSSASVGILQALSMTGTITYGAALPIIMGQNIGTCVTALISCIGANKNARRAAMVHLYFNIIGTIVFMIVYAVTRYLFALPLFGQMIDAAGVAVVHSIFNVVCTCLLLPFSKMLEKLACLTIPDHADAEEKTVLLDERLLATPAFAVSRCRDLTVDMADETQKGLMMSIDLLTNYSNDVSQKVIDSENRVDVYEDKLGTFLVKLSAASITGDESRETSKILHGISDLERISDHSVNVMEVAQEMHNKKICFSPEAQRELDVLAAAVREIVELTLRAFRKNDVALAKWVEPLENVITETIHTLKTRHIDRLRAGKCTVEIGFIFNDLVANYERVAAHCSNLAICVIELAQGEMNAHEYTSQVNSGDEYLLMYNASKGKYSV